MGLYNITSIIQNNTVMNRGLMELGGVAVPQTAMSNNRTEAKERLSKSALFFSVTFLSPFVTIRLLNKGGLKLFKVTKQFNAKDGQIIQLSNNYLKGNLSHMREGIKELGEKLKKRKDANFDRILSLDNKELESLRKNLIKTKNTVFGADFLFTGILTGSIPWGVNNLSKKVTKRSGFSAEFAMADDSYTDKKAEKFEKSKLKRYLTFVGITSTVAIAIPGLVASSLISKKPNKLLGAIKKHSEKFDYTDGIFMKLIPCFLMDAFGACVGEFLSCRDDYERRDLAIRLSFILAVFYGGDKVLNNISARLLDKSFKTKLVNRDTEGKFVNKIRSLEEISNLKNIDAKTLNRTKKAAVASYWGNLALTMVTLGFLLPFMLNKLLKNSVENEKKK